MTVKYARIYKQEINLNVLNYNNIICKDYTEKKNSITEFKIFKQEKNKLEW